MRARRKNKQETVTIKHYAPDVTVTALDYGLPITLEERMHRAEQRIRRFLNGTRPDNLCETFYDPYTAEEELALIAALQKQVPEHDGLNRALADKQRAELQRLDSALTDVANTIKAYEEELSELQQLFNRCNG